MFHLIQFVADAFLLATATVTIPSVLIGLISIAANRHRNGQQTETPKTPISAKIRQPEAPTEAKLRQAFARPEVSAAQAEEFAKIDPLAPIDSTPSKPIEITKPATTPAKTMAQPSEKFEANTPKGSKLSGSQRRAEQLKALLAAQQSQTKPG